MAYLDSASGIHLDPADFQDQPDLLPLVEVIAKETEAARARLRAKEPSLSLRSALYGGLIMSPEERHARHCALEPWYELLTDVLIIKRCAAKVGIDMATFLTHLIEDVGPPNWQLFFWMRACFQSVSVDHHNRMLKQFGDTARTVAWERAQKEHREQKSLQATNAADSRHDKPGGSRDKQGKIRAEWATGKFSDRGRCAGEECAALDMSFDAARRALRNAPDPDPWPAKKTKKGPQSA